MHSLTIMKHKTFAGRLFKRKHYIYTISFNQNSEIRDAMSRVLVKAQRMCRKYAFSSIIKSQLKCKNAAIDCGIYFVLVKLITYCHKTIIGSSMVWVHFIHESREMAIVFIRTCPCYMMQRQHWLPDNSFYQRVSTKDNDDLAVKLRTRFVFVQSTIVLISSFLCFCSRSNAYELASFNSAIHKRDRQ